MKQEYCPMCQTALGTSLTSCPCGWRALVAELEASLAIVRNDALEDAAKCCDDEADKCDDAVKWVGDRKYIANCKAAAYAVRDRAAAIRAMKG